MPHALVTNNISIKRHDLSIKKLTYFGFAQASGKNNKSRFNVRSGTIVKDLIILKLHDVHLIQLGQFM